MSKREAPQNTELFQQQRFVTLSSLSHEPIRVDGHPIKTMSLGALKSMVPNIDLEDGTKLADHIQIDTRAIAKFMKFAGIRRFSVELYKEKQELDISGVTGSGNDLAASHAVATTRSRQPEIGSKSIDEWMEEFARGESYNFPQTNIWVIGTVPVDPEKVRQHVQASRRGKNLRSPQAWSEAINTELMDGLVKLSLKNLLSSKYLQNFAISELPIQGLNALYAFINFGPHPKGIVPESLGEFLVRGEVFPHAVLAVLWWSLLRFSGGRPRFGELGALGPELTRSLIVKTIGALTEKQPNLAPHFVVAKK